MANWQVTGRLKVGFAALAGAVAVSLVAPAAAEAAATNTNPSPNNPNDQRAEAGNVSAHYKATPGGGSGPAASAPRQSSSANSSSPGMSGPSSPSPSQTKDKPPDRSAHKFSPQNRTPANANSPGHNSGSSPTTRVGVDRPQDRDPDKVTPQQRTPATPPPDRRHDKPGISSAPPQGLPGNSGATGTPTRPLPAWVPRKRPRIGENGNHDLVYRYRIVNGRKVDPTANPLDWDDWLNDIWNQINQFNMAYGKQFYDYWQDLLNLIKLGYDTRIERFITDRAGWNATTAELVEAVKDDWTNKINGILAFSDDPVGETREFLDNEWNRFTANPAAYLGEVTGQGVILGAEALAGEATGGAGWLGAAARRGLRDAIDVPAPKRLPNGTPDRPPAPRAPERAPAPARAPEAATPGRAPDPVPNERGNQTAAPAAGRPDGSGTDVPAKRHDGAGDRDRVPVAVAPGSSGNAARQAAGGPTHRSPAGRATPQTRRAPGTGAGADHGTTGPRSAKPGANKPRDGAKASPARPTRRGGIGPVRKGQAGVDNAVRAIEASGGRVLGREITVDTPAGRTRPDLLVELPNHQRVFVEVKNGPGAGLTSNQQRAFPLIRSQGGVVRGRKAAGAGLRRGAQIPPTPVWVVYWP
jgi:hypothetical protein